jgi:hypothetical protein
MATSFPRRHPDSAAAASSRFRIAIEADPCHATNLNPVRRFCSRRGIADVEGCRGVVCERGKTYLAVAFQEPPDTDERATTYRLDLSADEISRQRQLDALDQARGRRDSAQRWGMLLNRILTRAHIKSCERIFHNLRASRQTELTTMFSIGTVCRWLGNSIAVADLHYLSALESEFDRAATEGGTPKAEHKQAQQTMTNHGKSLHTDTRDHAETLEITQCAKKVPEACKSQGG